MRADSGAIYSTEYYRQQVMCRGHRHRLWLWFTLLLPSLTIYFYPLPCPCRGGGHCGQRGVKWRGEKKTKKKNKKKKRKKKRKKKVLILMTNTMSMTRMMKMKRKRKRWQRSGRSIDLRFLGQAAHRVLRLLLPCGSGQDPLRVPPRAPCRLRSRLLTLF